MNIEAVYCDVASRALVKVYEPGATPEYVEHVIYPRGRAFDVVAPQSQVGGAPCPRTSGYRRYVPGIDREDGL